MIAPLPSPPTTQTISPAIFYWGTPVVLISSSNEDSTTNLAPISSARWLGNRCMLNLASLSRTTTNILRTQQCVLNLASSSMTSSVNALARSTGTPNISQATPSVPFHHFKRMAGYNSIHDKFHHANLTPVPSQLVAPDRIVECPAQMDCSLVDSYDMFSDKGQVIMGLNVQVLRTHVHDKIRMAGHRNRIDPDLWHPMIMSFQGLYGINPRKVAESDLARIGEESCRGFSNPIEGEGEEGPTVAE